MIGDSKHEIIDMGFPNGERLHRFTNPGGQLYSAIYDKDGEEVYNCERHMEKDMIAKYVSIHS